MNYCEFLEQLRVFIEQRSGGDYQVSLNRILKNNGTCYDSITVCRKGVNIAPAICLNDFYEFYQQGVSIESIADQVFCISQEYDQEDSIDLSFYTDYNRIKDRIVCRLVNYEKNRSLLERIPHTRFLDLAIVYYCRLEHWAFGEGTVLIQKAHMELWDISVDELHNLAVKNTGNLLPFELIDLQELVEDTLGWSAPGEEMDRQLMYILTNQERKYGAVNLIYGRVLKEVAERIHDSFYILPSSIHECMIVPAERALDAKELHHMVSEINHTCVAEEDVLGDSVYYYDRKQRVLSVKYRKEGIGE